MFPEHTFLPGAQVRLTDFRYATLLSAALARIPADVPPISTVTHVHLRKRGVTRDFAALTRYRYPEWSGMEGRAESGRQTITFYTELLSQLSDPAALAVVAHELAHAWLNEHVEPEESEAREIQADQLAREWGFGEELDALSGEVE